MERLSRYGRRMRITLIKTMTVACFVCIIAIPFLSKNLLKTELIITVLQLMESRLER